MAESEVMRRIEAMDHKLARLADNVSTLDKDQAVMKVETKATHQEVLSMKGAVSRLFWIVATALVVALVKEYLDGVPINGR